MNVTIVCGPPGAGKSQYVKERMKWGDLIVDMDMLYQALSWLPKYEKPQCLLQIVKIAREAIIDSIPEQEDIRHVWIVTSGAKLKERTELAEWFGIGGRANVEVVMLDVSPGECLSRIYKDETRKDKWQAWDEIIKRWWKEYEPGG